MKKAITISEDKISDMLLFVANNWNFSQYNQAHLMRQAVLIFNVKDSVVKRLLGKLKEAHPFIQKGFDSNKSRIRLPKEEREQVDPATAAIFQAALRKWNLPSEIQTDVKTFFQPSTTDTRTSTLVLNDLTRECKGHQSIKPTFKN